MIIDAKKLSNTKIFKGYTGEHLMLKTYKSLIIFLIILVTFFACSESKDVDTMGSENTLNVPLTKENNDETDSQKKAYKISFIEIGSVNCIPCKAMQPIIKEIEEEYEGIVNVIFYDVWTKQGRKDAEIYGAKMIPTQVFLDENGDEFFRHEGFFPKEELVKIIENNLKE